MNGTDSEAIEEQLRAMFADPRRTVPDWPDPTSSVRSGMRRRQHRRVTVGAFCATVVTLIGVVFSAAYLKGSTVPPTVPNATSTSQLPSPTVDPSGGADVIPWKDLPLANQDVTPSPRPRAATCRTSALVLDSIDSNGAGGTATRFIGVHNAGHTRCTLSGSPVLLQRKNSVTSVVATTAAYYLPGPGLTPATIDPGEPAFLEVEAGMSCNGGINPTDYPNLALRLADGGVLQLNIGVSATCGDVRLGTWHLRPAQQPTVDPLAALVVSIEAPAVVHIGETFDFIVTLTNPSDHDIALTPCPNYEVTLQFVKVAAFHQLNCAVSTVPAHHNVRFAMRLTVPSFTTYIGQSTLEWKLVDNTTGGKGDAPITVQN